MSDCFLIILDELSGQSRMEVNDNNESFRQNSPEVELFMCDRIELRPGRSPP